MGHAKTLAPVVRAVPKTRIAQATRAAVEQLERRVFLSVSASVSGASSVNEASAYTLNLSASSTAGTISSWAINWGDGTQGSPDIVGYSGTPTSESHIYASGPNNYTISATAADSTNATASATKAIGVLHVPPYLYAHVSATTDPGVEGMSFECDMSATEWGNHTISGWTVNWGDGSPVQTAQLFPGGSGLCTHVYTTAGTYRWIATATDDVGAYTTSSYVSWHRDDYFMGHQLGRWHAGQS